MTQKDMSEARFYLPDHKIDDVGKFLRRIAYFWTAISFIIVQRWVKISREDVYLLDVASESNIWTWLNVVYMVLAAASLYATAYMRRQNGAVFKGWGLTATAILLLSLDDMISIHERLEVVGLTMGGGSGFLHFAWVIPGMIVAAVLLAIFTLTIQSASASARRGFALGIAMFFGGAFGLEMVSGAILSSYGPYGFYAAFYHVEELLEAVGMVFILCAALKELSRHGRGSGFHPAVA